MSAERRPPRLLALHGLVGDEPEASSEEVERAPSLGSPRRPRLRTVVVAAALLWLGLSVIQVALAYRDGERASEHARRARRSLESTEILAAGAHLERARELFSAASERSGGATTLPLHALPVLGRQLRSFSQLNGAAEELVSTGGQVVEGLATLPAQQWPPPGERAPALRRVAAVALAAEERLSALDVDPPEALVAPLARRWAELERLVSAARQNLGHGALLLEGLADFLEGPRRYLVLAANNAEMRAGSGMFLSAGVLSVEAGRFQLGPMRPTGELTLTESVDVPPDVANLWGWLEPGREWRNLSTTPRFGAVAPIAARMWEAESGVPVDGVLSVDVELLKQVLATTGPLPVGGVSVGEAEVVRLILHDQYVGVQAQGQGQAERRERLGRIAAAVIDALGDGGYSPVRMALSLARATEGRHLMAWSSLPADQAMWERAHAAGELEEDSLAVSVLNQGGNKLDQFISIEAALELRASRAVTEATLRLALRNETPEDAPPYVAGPHPETELAAGEYQGIVALNLPRSATQVAFATDHAQFLAGTDGPTTLVATRLRLARGQAHEIVVRFRLPPQQRSLVVEPSARIPPIEWNAGPLRWHDHRRQTLTWSPTAEERTPPSQ